MYIGTKMNTALVFMPKVSQNKKSILFQLKTECFFAGEELKP